MNNLTIENTDTVHLYYSTQWFHGMSLGVMFKAFEFAKPHSKGNRTDFSTQPPTNVSLLSSDDVHTQLVLTFPCMFISGLSPMKG